MTIRQFAALLLALAILPGTVLRERMAPGDHAHRIAATRLVVPEQAQAALGPFRLIGAWHFASRDALFGGYSALLARPGGRLLAISDRGDKLDFAEPPGGPAPFRMDHTTRDPADWNSITDAEAASAGPHGEIWIAWEDRKAISRFSPDMAHEMRIFPPALQPWSAQFGPESMARLADGRFLIVSEDFIPRTYEREHDTLVFASDPTAGAYQTSPGTVMPGHARMTLPGGYRPTDMALLPDGRALVLLRQLVWPLPMRFSCRIALADPAELGRTGRWSGHEIARLDSPLPSDNYEGIAVRPRGDGKLDVWVISDDNQAATQRTLLLKLELDPRNLPPRK